MNGGGAVLCGVGGKERACLSVISGTGADKSGGNAGGESKSGSGLSRKQLQ